MNRILISGGVQRPNGFELGDGKFYECAKLLSLDLETSEIAEILSFSEGNENFPSEYPNLEFTCACIEEDKIWIPTDTEVRLYSYPEMKMLKIFSHPCFHNIHSVVVRDADLYVTSTGVDMVVVMDKVNGTIRRRINAEGKPLWHRFSPETDYRKLHSTRPHDCHPNYVFWIDGQPWVTRCTQEDAVCLEDFGQRIDITGGSGIAVHDGHVIDDKIFFTTVDGCIAIADSKSKKVLEMIKLYEFEGFGGIRGWCRGLMFDDGIVYVGFSRLRKTRAKGKLAWVKKLAGKGQIFSSASIVAFDLYQRKIIEDYLIEDGLIDAIYSLVQEPVVSTTEQYSDAL